MRFVSGLRMAMQFLVFIDFEIGDENESAKVIFTLKLFP
jgi:hypothetical protein